MQGGWCPKPPVAAIEMIDGCRSKMQKVVRLCCIVGYAIIRKNLYIEFRICFMEIGVIPMRCRHCDDELAAGIVF